MLTSRLFQGDEVLEAVAANRDRISRTRHRRAPAVTKVQQVLLVWDPTCLPLFGADGVYGDETAGAVKRFKIEVLGVPESQVIDDVGPRTVEELDRIQAAHERSVDVALRTALLDGWLNVPLSGFTSDVSTSSVHAHDSGETAFHALREAIDRCTDERAFVAIAGWDFRPDTLIDPGLTIADALTAAAGRGVRLRALLSGSAVVIFAGGIIFPVPQAGADNSAGVAFVRSLPGGAAILDRWVLHRELVPPFLGGVVAPIQVGTHHQKVWVVFDGQDLRVFTGGVDIDPNRTLLAGTPPWHDVQLELQGEVALAAYEVVRQRWNHHPVRPPGVELPPLGPTAASRNQRARVLTTFGNPTAFAGVAGPPYPWAPTGSKAIRDFLHHAISRSESFIYVEDQYLVDASIGAALAARMPTLAGLVIVIPFDNAVNGELHQAVRRRAAVLAPLAPFMDKVAVVVAAPFVHSKLWIFDDTVALVGSANSNRRGYTHDSEVAVAFGDLAEPGAVASLRQRLWNRHLGPAAAAANASPLTSIGTWKAATFASGAKVDAYVPLSDPNPNPLPLASIHRSTLVGW